MDEMIFCYNCGLAVKPGYVSGFKLLIVSVNGEEHYFCNEKCKRAYERKERSYNARKNFTGKRQGYGVTGL